MSLEKKIEALTVAIVEMTSLLKSTMPAQPVAQAPMVATVPVAQVAPVDQVPVAQFAAAPQAPAMPAPPSFITPVAPAVAVVAAPFTDLAGLGSYLMERYGALGPEKGLLINSELAKLGYSNVSEVKPDHYAALYAGVQALG